MNNILNHTGIWHHSKELLVNSVTHKRVFCMWYELQAPLTKLELDVLTTFFKQNSKKNSPLWAFIPPQYMPERKSSQIAAFPMPRRAVKEQAAN